jgi:hypothetical protein
LLLPPQLLDQRLQAALALARCQRSHILPVEPQQVEGFVDDRAVRLAPQLVESAAPLRSIAVSSGSCRQAADAPSAPGSLRTPTGSSFKIDCKPVPDIAKRRAVLNPGY